MFVHFTVVYFMLGGILPFACGKNLQNPERIRREEDAAYERAQCKRCCGGIVIISVDNVGVSGSSKYRQYHCQPYTVAIVRIRRTFPSVWSVADSWSLLIVVVISV